MLLLRDMGVLLSAVVLFLLSGCAATHDKTGEGSAVSEAEINTSGWWFARFQIKTYKDGIKWYIDPLLANEVVAPVIEKYGDEITLWRFHRRAVKDL